MNNSHKHLLILILLSVAGWTATSAAQDAVGEDLEPEALPMYAIELIVFKRHDLSNAYPEDFSPREMPQSEFDLPTAGVEINAPPLADDSAENTVEPLVLEYELIPDELLALTSIFERLTEIDRYEPLLHLGWVQAGFEDQMALPFEVAVVSEDDALLSGTVTLRRSRFLHLDVDLMLEQTGQVSHHLHETRKIPPPYATHYFDHPAMSVIARVNHFEAIEQPPLEPELPDDPGSSP